MRRLLPLIALAGLGCPGATGTDAGYEGGVDAGLDGGFDPAADAGADGGPGAGPDAGLDGGSSDGGALGSDGGAAGGFVRAPVNVPAGALCDIPPGYVADGGNPTFIRCDVEADRFAPDASTASALKVVAWNVEYGKASAQVLQALQTNSELAGADVLLLSEVARASLTSSPANLNQARELARALSLDYVFAVEWDRREKPAELGEHGVAVLSRYPIGNVRTIRHTPLNDWYGQSQLYGGRITLGADLLVNGRRIRVYSSHLCTRGIGDSGRALQGAEVRVDADLPANPPIQVVGGDLNTYTCSPALYDCTVPPNAEKVVKDFLDGGWSDGTAGWNGYSQVGAGFFLQRLDWLFYRGATAVPGHAVTNATGSDHYPLVFTLSL